MRYVISWRRGFGFGLWRSREWENMTIWTLCFGPLTVHVSVDTKTDGGMT